MSKTTNSSLWLFNKNFLLLSWWQLISLIWTQAFMIAMIFFVKNETESATLVWLLVMAWAIPIMLFSLIWWVLADNYSRRKIMIISNLVSFVAVFFLVISIVFLNLSTWATITILFVVFIILWMARWIERPPLISMIPNIVSEKRLSSANAIIDWSIKFGTLIWNSLWWIMFRLLWAPIMFLIDSISYLIAAITRIFINYTEDIEKKEIDYGKCKSSFCKAKKMFVKETKDWYDYMKKQSWLKELFILEWLMNFLLIPLLILLPFYVTDYLWLSLDYYWYIMATFWLWSFLWYIIAWIKMFKWKVRMSLIMLAYVITSVWFALLWLVIELYAVFLIIFVLWLLQWIINVNVITIIQNNVEDKNRWKLFGFFETVAWSVYPLSVWVSWILFDLIGKNFTLMFVGIWVIVLFLSIIIIFKAYRSKCKLFYLK